MKAVDSMALRITQFINIFSSLKFDFVRSINKYVFS